MDLEESEESAEQHISRLISDVKSQIENARELAILVRRNSTLTAEELHNKKSETHRELSEQVLAATRSLRGGVSKLLHELGFLFDRLEERNGSSWPEIIRLKREYEALVVSERPVSQIESAWVEDRLLAIQGLLGKMAEPEKPTSATIDADQESVRPLPTTAGTVWSDVSIVFLNEQRIRVTIRGVRNDRDYWSAGFGNKTTAKWVTAWTMLITLASNHGEIERPVSSQDISRVEKSIQDLRKRLRRLILIAEDPLPFHKKSYRARFAISLSDSY